MALSGTYSRNLDGQNRFAVPKRLREQFSDEEPRELYIAPGTERSLSIYSVDAFERLAERLRQRSSNRAEVRNYLRLFYSRAEKVELDGQGRVRIPDRLVEFAGLKKEIVLLGALDHAEVWDSALWQEFVETHAARFDDLATGAFE